MLKSNNNLDNFIRSQFISRFVIPILAPINGFCIPADTPTVQRSCDIAEIPGADAEGTVR